MLEYCAAHVKFGCTRQIFCPTNGFREDFPANIEMPPQFPKKATGKLKHLRSCEFVLLLRYREHCCFQKISKSRTYTSCTFLSVLFPFVSLDNLSAHVHYSKISKVSIGCGENIQI